MISKLLEPLPGFTRAYKLAHKLNTAINYSDFYRGVVNYQPIIFRQFYEATINRVPSKQIKERIINYGK